MRITFVVASVDYSGGFRVIATYAKMLHERGHSVCVVVPPRRKSSLKDYYRALRNGLPISEKSDGHHLSGTSVPVCILDRFRPVEENDVPDADIVFATWWLTVDWVMSLSPSKGVKAHLVQDYELYGMPKEIIDHQLVQPTAKIAVSRWLAEILIQKLNQKNVALVPNSVDLDQFYSQVRNKQKVPTVGFLYSPMHSKGCDIALKAIDIASKYLPELRVICFGRIAPANSFDMPKNASFYLKPTQSELRIFYSQCDAWLFPTRAEGFGLPILEAMACRTPVIATPAGAAPELIAQGGGRLVPMEEAAAMAAAIVDIAGLPNAEWQELSGAAYRTATSYTWSDAVELLESTLQKIMEKN